MSYFWQPGCNVIAGEKQHFLRLQPFKLMTMREAHEGSGL